MAIKKITNSRFAFVTLLIGGMAIGCNCAHPKGSSDSQPPKAAAVVLKDANALQKRLAALSSAGRRKYINDHLIAVVDSLARRFSITDLDSVQLKKMTAGFSMYLPVVSNGEVTAVPHDAIVIGLFKSKDPMQADVIRLVLPELMGTQLDFNSLIAHFGPLEFQDPIFRKAKMLPSVALNLDGHLKKVNKFNPKHQMSLLINATNVPEEKDNQINFIELVKWKEPQDTNQKKAVTP